MKSKILYSEHKFTVKPDCFDIIEGSKLFINAQIVLQLVSKIVRYQAGEEKLEIIFSYANCLNKLYQKRLYKEVKQEIDEICFLEKEIKEGEIKPLDKRVIDFFINCTLLTFIKGIPRKG